ncbi:nitrilase-related carbon-nitrogen hydrolase [Roseisalinus antarcticus]|uniref:Formamidase n=1 Tax=Roseisalinus antarcticus TaxID=254357 RepID=A0A1Y5T8X4_9RHOB|nr:nitrilase-related carbon-nitrogen hydrolase [Roseisalinus antarcticus]SLN56481.1 Formamidase [Roseisalinus antarcticus]
MAIAPWRATCIQIESVPAFSAETKAGAWSVINGNIAVAIAAIKAACAGDAPPKLVVLPEFAFQGPPRSLPTSLWIERACTTIPGAITDQLAEVARAQGIYIAGNHFEVDPRWPDRCFNSSFLLDPKGEVILRYRRINTGSWTSPHDILDEYREAYGDDGIYPVAETELGRLAIYPCGEVSVPEITRMFMMRGAEVILHPNNEPPSPVGDAAKLCRAAENMCYLVSCNVAGTIGFSDTATGGHSQIIDHRGQILASEDSAEPTNAVTAMIDIDALQAARMDTGMGNALMRSRFAMYRDLYSAAEFYPANALADGAVETLADFAPVHRAALANLARAGVLREG